MSWCTLYVVITAKNKELLLKIFCGSFLPLFGKISQNSATHFFSFCGPFSAFWPEFLPPGNTAEDLFTAGRPVRQGKQGGQQEHTTHSHTSWWGGGGAGVGGGGGPDMSSQFSHTQYRSYSWDSGYAGVIESKWRSSVLWFAADCIPIVGAAKSLVLNDKRFNHTKVWCIFIFIDLQAS